MLFKTLDGSIEIEDAPNYSFFVDRNYDNNDILDLSSLFKIAPVREALEFLKYAMCLGEEDEYTFMCLDTFIFLDYLQVFSMDLSCKRLNLSLHEANIEYFIEHLAYHDGHISHPEIPDSHLHYIRNFSSVFSTLEKTLPVHCRPDYELLSRHNYILFRTYGYGHWFPPDPRPSDLTFFGDFIMNEAIPSRERFWGDAIMDTTKLPSNWANYPPRPIYKKKKREVTFCRLFEPFLIAMIIIIMFGILVQAIRIASEFSMSKSLRDDLTSFKQKITEIKAICPEFNEGHIQELFPNICSKVSGSSIFCHIDKEEERPKN